MPSTDYAERKIVNGKFICTGTFFNDFGKHGQTLVKTFDVRIPHPEKTYIVHIAKSMLSAPRGDFDENDTVFADIDLIDNRRMDDASGYGGVHGRHFKNYGEWANMGICSYVGTINSMVRFRIVITGDDWVGASFLIMEL